VHALVDGQQRITTIILYLAELYKYLSKINENAHNSVNGFEVYKGKLNDMVERLKSFLFTKNTWKTNKDEYLPKLINGSHEDIWRRDGKQQYNSPVAKYLWELSTNIEAKIKNDDILKLTKIMEEAIRDFISVAKNVNIKKC